MNNKNQNLPKGWVVVKLGDIVIFQKGKKPKNVSPEKNENCQIPYINIKAFEKNIIDEYTDGIGCIFCENGDLVMVWDGARAGYVGKSIKGALGSTLMKLSFPKILKNYAYYFLSSKFLQINTNAKGTGIPHVNPDLLWNFDFPLPPLSEQHRIVAKIEELFSSLDKAVERLKATREQLKIYRQAVLKWAFEGRFTHKDIKQGELPKGWVWVKLGEVCNEIKPGFPFGRHNKEKIGIPQLRPMNINIKGMIDLSDVKYIQPEKEYDKLIKGDVLFNNTNSPALLGKTSYIRKNTNWTYSNHMTRIRLNESLANPAWVSYYLHSLFLSGFFRLNCTNHVNQASINTKFLENKVIIPLPPLSEQQQIVSEIEKRLSVAEKVEESIRVALEKAERLRQSILKKAFEGKLVPQDPNDEPASVLLEKIKAEKKQHRKQK